MAVDVVIGGQRGDEGKGNICTYLGTHGDYSIALRSASPQAGHSITLGGKRVGLAHLPCASVNPKLRILIGGGSFISPEQILYGGEDHRIHTGETLELLPEIPALGLTPERLGIDHRAKIVTEEHLRRERGNERLMALGSIGSGVNTAKLELIYKEAKFIGEDPGLAVFATDTVEEMAMALKQSRHILFETDHGIELCQHFGPVFPFNTARIVNTAAYLGEAGLPPQSVRRVYLVIKPYITAVAKDAPLRGEIHDDKTLAELLETGGETGSRSGRIRRVGIFDPESFRKSIILSGATDIAISHLDLSEHAWKVVGFNGESDFLETVERVSDNSPQRPRISLVSRGPSTEDVTEYR